MPSIFLSPYKKRFIYLERVALGTAGFENYVEPNPNRVKGRRQKTVPLNKLEI